MNQPAIPGSIVPTTSNPKDDYVRVQKGEVVALDDPLFAIMPGGIAVRGDVMRVPIIARIPAVYQNVLGSGKTKHVGMSAAGYDYINRDLGVRFFEPKMIGDPLHGGAMRPNPIIRKDYILYGLVGQWWNDMGQMMTWSELIEVDYNLVYQDARVNGWDVKIATDQQGNTLYHAPHPPQPNTAPSCWACAMPWPCASAGTPVLRVPAEAELKALRQLSMLRTYGTRYVRTVARTRILKVASAINVLPGTGRGDKAVEVDGLPVKLVAFRDNLTPDEAERRAAESMVALFGSSAQVTFTQDEVLPDDVMRDIDGERPDNVIEGQVLDVTGVPQGTPGQGPAFDPASIPGLSRGMPGERIARNEARPVGPSIANPDAQPPDVDDPDFDPDELEAFIQQQQASRGG